MYDNDIELMIEILKKHNIEMSVGGCGCCHSPWVTFVYEGKVIVNDKEDASFDTRDNKNV